MKPIIGILGPHGLNQLYNNTVSVSTVSLNEVYAAGVVRAGGIPLVITPLEDDEDLYRLIDQCDGLLFPGGEDVDPRFYNQSPSAKLGRVNQTFDRAWVAAAKYAVERGMPIFGICRGMQIVNVALGGSLYQDMSEFPGTTILHGQKQVRSYPMHPVNVEETSDLYRLLGEKRVYTNTMHHQSVHEPGHGLKVVARADDGVVEALEDEKNEGKITLVQWHPEELQDTVPCMRGLFRGLVERAEKYRDMNGQAK